MTERKIVVIDAGHGGAEPGAIFEGRREKADALRLALAVGEILSRDGVDVRYTRTGDSYQTPLQKAVMANEAEADYFVSLHRNAMPIPGSASGVLSLVFENKGVPALLAGNINGQLAKAGFADLGIMERPGLVVLRKTEMPAVLVEVGFIDNEADNQLFDQNFHGIARAIADGILITFKEEAEAKPEYYQVQTGAYRIRSLAEQQLNTLYSQGFPAFLIYEDGYFKIRVGAFLELNNAVSMEQALRGYGYNTFIVRHPAVY